MFLSVLAIACVAGLTGGCVNIDPGALEAEEHREDRAVQPAAANIILNVSTVNGDVEIRELPGATGVEVTFDVFAAEGHLHHVLTGTNGTRVDNDTVIIEATAKVSKDYQNEIARHGANIIVTVPQGSRYELDLSTVNGNIMVPALDGGSLITGTVNGNVDIIAGNLTTIDAHSANGDITVRLSAGTKFFVDASAANGRVRHGSIHMAPTTENDRTLVGPTEAGNGSLCMALRTVNGQIEISY